MRIFVANEAGDVLIKAMQITAQKAQPQRRGPETTKWQLPAPSSISQQIGTGQDKGAWIAAAALTAGTRDGARVMDPSLHNGVLIDTLSGES